MATITNTQNISSLFDGNSIDAKAVFYNMYHTFPNVFYIDEIDGGKNYQHFVETYKNDIQHKVLNQDFYKSGKKFKFDYAIIFLKNAEGIIEFYSGCLYFLTLNTESKWQNILSKYCGTKREKRKQKPFEINMLVSDRGNLEMRPFELKRTKLDLSIFYNDDFLAIDKQIQNRLNKKDDKGIVLLHGLPGTGKTTYLRYLIGKLKKRVIFLSPSIAGNIMNPDLLKLLISNPNCILVIEDAENIIQDRRYSNNASVSNLLNLSDGLMADFLNIQIVCTFNADLAHIDNALLREGRLIAKYEFNKLSVHKANALAKHLKIEKVIKEPMTLAEITNPHEVVQINIAPTTIGFKRNSEQTIGFFNHIKEDLKEVATT